jgi:hypothetical protein
MNTPTAVTGAALAVLRAARADLLAARDALYDAAMADPYPVRRALTVCRAWGTEDAAVIIEGLITGRPANVCKCGHAEIIHYLGHRADVATRHCTEEGCRCPVYQAAVTPRRPDA